MLFRLTLIAVGSLLMGCVTPNGGTFRGMMESAGPGKLHTLQIDRFGPVEQAITNRYVIYRGAEIAQQQNKPNFRVFRGLNEAAMDYATKIPLAIQLGYSTSTTTFVLAVDATQSKDAFETSAILREMQADRAIKPNASPVSAPEPEPSVAPGMVNIRLIGGGDLRTCKGDVVTKLKTIKAGTSEFIQVPAGERITLRRHHHTETSPQLRFCTGIVSFLPQTGNSYVLHGRSAYKGATDVCGMDLVRNDPATVTGVAREESVGPSTCPY